MPLAEAITQLSFPEFLQRCGVPIAPPSRLSYQCPSHSWMLLCRQTRLVTSFRMCPRRRLINRTPRFLSMWQCTVSTSYPWMLPCTLSQHVSTQMGSRLASSFSVDVFVQTPVRSVVLHDVAIQLPLTEFFIGCIFSNDPLDSQNFVRQSPSSAQDDIGSDLSSLTCTITRPNLGCADLVRKLAPRALLQPPPGLEQLAPPSGLATGSHLYTTHGASVSNAPPRVRLRSAISV